MVSEVLVAAVVFSLKYDDLIVVFGIVAYTVAVVLLVFSPSTVYLYGEHTVECACAGRVFPSCTFPSTARVLIAPSKAPRGRPFVIPMK